MTTRTAELDPEAIQRSIIYFKEKLECANESFEASASYNMQRAINFSNYLALLLFIITVLMIISLSVSKNEIFIVIDQIVTSLGLLAFCTLLILRHRDYNSCWSAHAYAAMRIRAVDLHLKCLDNEGIVTTAKLKELYEDYRSVYNETLRKLQ